MSGALDNQYDLNTLRARSQLWRDEAETATLLAVRNFCLAEAERYDGMVQRSMDVPVLEAVKPAPFT